MRKETHKHEYNESDRCIICGYEKKKLEFEEIFICPKDKIIIGITPPVTGYVPECPKCALPMYPSAQ